MSAPDTPPPDTTSPGRPRYHLVLSHRRRPSVSQHAFSAWLRVERANDVVAAREALGFSGYAQLHEAARLDPLYIGLRLSRSVPVTWLLRLARGLPAPVATPRDTRREERWSGLELLAYDSHAELVAALTSPAGAEALRGLAEAHASRADLTAVTTAEIVPVTPDPQRPVEQMATLFHIRALPTQDRAKLQQHWKTDHRALVERLKPALGYRAYDQNHARSDTALDELAQPLGDALQAPYDGVAALTYASRLALLARFLDPRAQIANFRLVADEVGFINERRSSLVYGRLVSIS